MSELKIKLSQFKGTWPVNYSFHNNSSRFNAKNSGIAIKVS